MEYDDLIASFKTTKIEQKEEEEEKVDVAINFCNKCDCFCILNNLQYECPKCGEIKDVNNIYTGIDWKSHDTSGDYSNSNIRATTVNTLLPKSSLSTNMLFPKNKTDFRLRKVHSWIQMPSRERALNSVFKELTYICDNLKLDIKTTNIIKNYYSKISLIKINRGKIRKAVIASCIYFAIKQLNIARTPVEICKEFNIKKTDFTKGLKRVRDYLIQLGINNTNIINIEQNIERFVYEINKISNLNISDLEIFKKEACNHPLFDLINVSYLTNIALILYNVVLKNQLKVHIDTISKICNVSCMTIVRYFKMLRENK